MVKIPGGINVENAAQILDQHLKGTDINSVVGLAQILRSASAEEVLPILKSKMTKKTYYRYHEHNEHSIKMPIDVSLWIDREHQPIYFSSSTNGLTNTINTDRKCSKFQNLQIYGTH